MEGSADGRMIEQQDGSWLVESQGQLVGRYADERLAFMVLLARTQGEVARWRVPSTGDVERIG